MSAAEQATVRHEGKAVLQAILALALVALGLVLAFTGLDALNDLMARGFASMRSPGS